METLKNGKLSMTYNEYDTIWDLVDNINRMDIDSKTNLRKIFFSKNDFPTVEEMESHHVRENLKDYFPFLLFYYNNPLEFEDGNREYARTIAYITSLIDSNIELVDEDVCEDSNVENFQDILAKYGMHAKGER